MSAGYFLEIFGGAGAVIIAVGGCLWKCLRSYEFKYDYEDEERSATDVLKSRKIKVLNFLLVIL